MGKRKSATESCLTCRVQLFPRYHRLLSLPWRLRGRWALAFLPAGLQSQTVHPRSPPDPHLCPLQQPFLFYFSAYFLPSFNPSYLSQLCSDATSSRNPSILPRFEHLAHSDFLTKILDAAVIPLNSHPISH